MGQFTLVTAVGPEGMAAYAGIGWHGSTGTLGFAPGRLYSLWLVFPPYGHLSYVGGWYGHWHPMLRPWALVQPYGMAPFPMSVYPMHHGHLLYRVAHVPRGRGGHFEAPQAGVHSGHPGFGRMALPRVRPVRACTGGTASARKERKSARVCACGCVCVRALACVRAHVPLCTRLGG